MTHKNEQQPDFRFRLLRSETITEAWRPQLQLVFILRGTGRFLYRTAYTVHERVFNTCN